LQSWGPKAEKLGILAELADALKVISHRLAMDPLVWGEERYRLDQMGLQVRCGIHAQLRVNFAVDEQRRIVYVTEFLPLTGHPLESAS
jgi:hypothetical protein